jgi:ABC-type glycerol-3-phosphate transport system permease component
MATQTVSERISTSGRVRAFTARRLAGRMGKILLWVAVVFGAAIMVLPFVWMVLTSLKHDYEVLRLPITWLPDQFLYLKNYQDVFARQAFGRFFVNSFIVTFGATFSSVIFSSLGGYAFAKFQFPGKELIFFLFILAVLMVPFEVVVVPLYLMFNRAGLTDTYLGIAGPNLLSAFGIFVMRQFMESIPDDYIDAARVDGHSELGIFARIVLPLSVPGLATLGTVKFIWIWNEFLWPLVIVRSDEMKTVILGLASYSGMWHTSYSLVTAAAFLSVIPMVILFVVFQQYIIQGMTMTGLKG